TPPMPVAKSMPRRSGATSGSPASAQASSAATSANCVETSRRLAVGRSRIVSGRTDASAANVTGREYSSTQSYSRARAPETPARRFFQLSATVPPRAEVAPMPVTTMRLVIRGFLAPSAGGDVGAPLARRPSHHLRVRGDEVDSVLDGLEVLDLLVGDRHAELLLGVDDDRHHRDRVDVEVVRERLLERDLTGVDSGLVGDELSQAREDLVGVECHGFSPCWWRSRSDGAGIRH